MESGLTAEKALAGTDLTATATTGADPWQPALTVIRGGGGHVWVGDEAPSHGGGGLGPSPFTQLFAALAHCTLTTISGQARRHDIDLQRADCHVDYRVNQVLKGIEHPDVLKLRITRLIRSVTVWGSISDEQIATLETAANCCPVSNSLEGAIRITTRLQRGEAIDRDES